MDELMVFGVGRAPLVSSSSSPPPLLLHLPSFILRASSTSICPACVHRLWTVSSPSPRCGRMPPLRSFGRPWPRPLPHLVLRLHDKALDSHWLPGAQHGDLHGLGTIFYMHVCTNIRSRNAARHGPQDSGPLQARAIQALRETSSSAPRASLQSLSPFVSNKTCNISFLMRTNRKSRVFLLRQIC